MQTFKQFNQAEITYIEIVTIIALSVALALNLPEKCKTEANAKFPFYALMLGFISGLAAWISYELMTKAPEERRALFNDAQGILMPLLGMLLSLNLHYGISATYNCAKALLFSSRSKEYLSSPISQPLLEDERPNRDLEEGALIPSSSSSPSLLNL